MTRTLLDSVCSLNFGDLHVARGFVTGILGELRLLSQFRMVSLLNAKREASDLGSMLSARRGACRCLPTVFNAAGVPNGGGRTTATSQLEFRLERILNTNSISSLPCQKNE